MPSSARCSRLRDFIAKTFTAPPKPAEGGLSIPTSLASRNFRRENDIIPHF